MIVIATTKETDVTLVKELEQIFTIDGSGRPKKCSRFLELIEKYGIENILALTKEISKREFK